MMRWKLKLEEFEFDIVHKKGSLNTNADCLSRLFKMTLKADQPKHRQVALSPDSDETPNADLNTDERNLEASISYKNFQDTLNRRIITNSRVRDSDEDLTKHIRTNVCVLINKEVKLDETTEAFVEKFEPLSRLKSQNLDVHSANMLKINDDCSIIYLITNSVEKKAEYEDLFRSFVSLRTFMLKHKLAEIYLANPSKLEQYRHLKVEIIRSMLRYIFQETNINVTIFHNNFNRNLKESEILEILQEYHVKPLGGHNGVNRTYKRIKMKHKWHNMYKDIKRFIKNCDTCKRNKIVRYTKEPLTITSTAREPFEKISMDIVGTLPVFLRLSTI